MSIWRRLLQLPDPPKLQPPSGRMFVFDDQNTVHAYEIMTADFNIYKAAGYFWLTMYVDAPVKIEPDDDMNPEPFLELNLPFKDDPTPRISAGGVFEVAPYHKELLNLTSMYYWTHESFDGSINVECSEDGTLAAIIEGKSDDMPVTLRAEFLRNRDRERSFN